MNRTPPAVDAPFLDRLKHATAGEHRRVEQRFRILDPGLSMDQYRRWLERLYGFYLPFEARLEAFAPQLGFDWAARVKTPLLVRDLTRLGVMPERLATLPRCAQLPVLTDLASVHGALYVLEGSTLGGQFIARHLATTLQLDATNGAVFFMPYGDRLRERWDEFRTHLAAAAAPEVEDEIIRAARATFTAIGDWLSAA